MATWTRMLVLVVLTFFIIAIHSSAYYHQTNLKEDLERYENHRSDANRGKHNSWTGLSRVYQKDNALSAPDQPDIKDYIRHDINGMEDYKDGLEEIIHSDTQQKATTPTTDLGQTVSTQIKTSSDGKSVSTARYSISTARDLASSARDSVSRAQDSVSTARDSLSIARDSVPSARDYLSATIDSVSAARDSVSTARDSVSAATYSLSSKETVSKARDSESTARGSVSAAKDSLSTSKGTVSTARDSVLTARDSVSTARDSVSTARDYLTAMIDSVSTTESVSTARDSISAAKDSVMIARDSVLTARDSVSKSISKDRPWPNIDVYGNLESKIWKRDTSDTKISELRNMERVITSTAQIPKSNTSLSINKNDLNQENVPPNKKRSASIISGILRSALSRKQTNDIANGKGSSSNLLKSMDAHFNGSKDSQEDRPEAFRFFGHYPFAEMDPYHRRLWLERAQKGRGSLSVEGTFLWTCGMIGTTANTAVFLTAAVSKYFRKPLHIMVSSLALLDLYVTFLYIPTYTFYLIERSRDLDDNKKWSETMYSYCNVSRGIFLFNASLSITIQVFIALYLFIMTCSKDLAHRVFNTKNTIAYIIAACAVNAALLFTPPFFNHPRVDFYPNGHLCSPLTHQKVGQWQLSNFKVMYHCSVLSFHITELLTICFFIINIFLAVVRGKLVRIKYGRKDKMANMNYSRAIHITAVVFSSFMLLWLPLYIVNFVDPNHELIPDAVHHLVFDMLLIKSCINPIIYIYAIKTLRFELRLLCMCKCTPEERRKALTPPKKTTTSFEGSSSDIQTSSYGF